MASVHDFNKAREAKATQRDGTVNDNVNKIIGDSKKAVNGALGDGFKHVVIYLLELAVKLCALASVLVRYLGYLLIFSSALSMIVLFYSGTQTVSNFVTQLLTPIGAFLISLLLKKSTFWVARFRHVQATKFGMVHKG